MAVTREQLTIAYNYKNYEQFCKLFDQYVKEGNGVDFDILYLYAYSLIKRREFDEAYRIARRLEEYSDKFPAITGKVFNLYYFCSRSIDAERVLAKCDDNSNLSYYYVICNYLLRGKVDEARKLLDEHFEDLTPHQYQKLKIRIYNHRVRHAFMETAYDAFISNNGDILSEGFVVYLKHRPEYTAKGQEDEKAAIRPYLVWKRVGKNLYIFPITTNSAKGGYLLYQQYYPNSPCDRAIRDSLCQTTTDNVLSVCDKLRDEDLRPVLVSLYDMIYFSRTRDEKQANDTFMQAFKQDVNMHSIIRIVDQNTRKNQYFFVIGINDNGYRVIELDGNYNPISTRVDFFKNNRLIYRVIEPTQEQLEAIKSKLPLHLLVHNFIGARIETIFGKYIVLDQNERYVACIGSVYSASYMNMEAIKKEDISKVIGYLSFEEVAAIKEMVKRNSKVSISTLLKHNK